ncbi:hypothetical protein BO82DRAFT_411977 [Aspergillus uvarum CBS 121591]|uniref:Oxidoreductase acuF-like C2H2 type zinc-finger domain-containing protein n=1 Tax=Aspergillus uvarum CBS 121591 TaxID=1448315 RepID=A0A319CBU9_9EURO|nr:hypothetical protein BO82DRAFT_411977 [Aspergillus uvarum CBS 121591]PYH83055.1 hypothetical protein BO82DRAFT_411977 [Aspergillus uvarum CBS 121591]
MPPQRPPNLSLTVTIKPPGQAPLVELARKCQRELDVLAARFADRAPHVFHVHRVQFAAWLEHGYVFETDRVDMTLDYRLRNKLEVRGVLFTGLESMMLGIRAYRRKLRKALKVVEAVEALEAAVTAAAAVAALGADEDGKDNGGGGGQVEQDGESSPQESASESHEEEVDAEFAEAPRHRQSEDPFTNALRFCRYEVWHLIRNLDWATDLLAHSSMYAPSVLLQDHPDYSVRDEWERDVNEEFQVVVRSALRHRCDVYNKVLNARLGTMVVNRRRALAYHSRFQDDSPMHVPRQNLNPATFVMAMRDAAHEEHPPRPTLGPGQEEFECPYCRFTLPAARYASHDAWRQHVLTDLEPYMCIFDACTAETNTFRTPQQWLYHMETSHSSTWTCRVPRCRGRTFYRQVAFEQHGINAHGYTSADLKTISHESRRPSPAIFRRCPFCGPRPGEDPPRNDDAYLGNVAAFHAAHRLYNHVARHLEEFALLAIPYPPREPVVPPFEQRGDSRYSRHILPIPRVADHGNWEWTFAESLPAYMYRRDVFPGSSRSSVSAASTPYYRPSTPVHGPDVSDLVDVVESEDADVSIYEEAELFGRDENGGLEGFDEFVAGVVESIGFTRGDGGS